MKRNARVPKRDPGIVKLLRQYILLSFSSERSRYGVCALPEFCVDLEDAGAVLANEREVVDDLLSAFLLLNLLGHKPVEHLAGGDIVFSLGKGI